MNQKDMSTKLSLLLLSHSSESSLFFKVTENKFDYFLIYFSGDQVLIINGRQLKNVTHQEAVNCFRECKTKIDIMVSRMIESKPQKGWCELV